MYLLFGVMNFGIFICGSYQARAMEQTLKEINRIIQDRFDKQKVSLREITSEICSALFDSLKKRFETRNEKANGRAAHKDQL